MARYRIWFAAEETPADEYESDFAPPNSGLWPVTQRVSFPVYPQAVTIRSFWVNMHHVVAVEALPPEE
jgi:hypothetical protein